MDIKNEKWGGRLYMDGTSFNKYRDGQANRSCVYGFWLPGWLTSIDHMWETDNCGVEDKHFTLCQKVLCKCIDFTQK